MKLAEAKERIELLEAQIKAITAILTELLVTMIEHTHTVTITPASNAVTENTKDTTNSLTSENNEDNK